MTARRFPAFPSAPAENSNPELKQLTPSPFTTLGNTNEAIFVRGIDFIFDEEPLFDTAVLLEITQHLIGRFVRFSEIEIARRRLSEAYAAAGYISSGVLLPLQDFENGIVVFQLIHGRLSSIDVSGANISDDGFGDLSESYIFDHFKTNHDEHFNINDLQENLRVLLEDPSVKKLRAVVRPGSALGETVLGVDVETVRPLTLQVALDNAGSPSVGSERLVVTGSLRNMIGYGDIVSGFTTLTRGSQGFGVSLEAPISIGLTPFFSVSYSSVDVIDAPLDDLDIETRAIFAATGVRVDLLKSSTQTLAAEARLNVVETKSSLLGERFSFSKGVDDGRTSIRTLSLGAEYVHRSSDQTVALRSEIGFGLNVVSATDTGDGPDATFVSWLGQAQLTQRLDEDVLLFLRGQAQLAGSSLLPAADIAIGGQSTVRGYPENVVVADQALLGSLEIVKTLGKLPIAELTPPTHRAMISATAFLDAGYAWDVSGDVSEALVGLGAGLRWNPAENIDVSFEAALGLEPLGSVGGKRMGNPEIHFGVSWRLPIE